MVGIFKYLKDCHVKQELIRFTLFPPQDKEQENKVLEEAHFFASIQRYLEQLELFMNGRAALLC